MNWRYPLLFCLILALPSFSVAVSEGTTSVAVQDAWVREPPPSVAMLAGYMVLQNQTSQRQVLVAASSSGFEMVMIHRTVVKNGVTSMVHVSQIELAPGAPLIFAPGRYHLMLINPKRALRAGDRVVINLEFRGNPVLPVEFVIRK